MALFQKILVPIDFGPTSNAAIERAVALASAFGSELAILHVFDEAPVFAYPGAPFIPIVDLSTALEKNARAAVEAVVEKLRARAPRVTGLVREGSAWRHIEAVAEEIHADLIVVGTHGRNGVSRALIGSVAEKVVRMASVPVLVVHADEPDAKSVAA